MQFATDEDRKRFERDMAASDIMQMTRLWLSDTFNPLTFVHEVYEGSKKDLDGQTVEGVAYVFYETDVDPIEAQRSIAMNQSFKWSTVRPLVTIFQPYDNITGFDVSVEDGIFTPSQVKKYQNLLSKKNQQKRNVLTANPMELQKRLTKLKKDIERRAMKEGQRLKKKKKSHLNSLRTN